MRGEPPEFMLHTDWELLARQKSMLLKTKSALMVALKHAPQIMYDFADNIEGVVGFLDAAMDSAADEFGLYTFPGEYEEVP